MNQKALEELIRERNSYRNWLDRCLRSLKRLPDQRIPNSIETTGELASQLSNALQYFDQGQVLENVKVKQSDSTPVL